MSRTSWLALALALAAGLLAALVFGWRAVPLRAPSTASPGASPRAPLSVPERQRRIPVLREREPASLAEPWIEGRIEDADGQPIVDGKVRLHCADGQSAQVVEGTILGLDDAGIVRGPGCRGITCAEFVHPSMIQSEVWELEAGQPTVLQARPLARQRGQVVDARGDPIAGARVLLDMSEGTDLFTTRNTVADGDGLFSFAFAERAPCDLCRRRAGACVPLDADPDHEPQQPPTMELLARAAGFRSARVHVELGDETPWRVELADAGAAIVGRLVDAEGHTYPRATILARSSEQPAEIHRASIEGADFEFAEVGQGTYELRAIQDGIELATAEAVAGVDIDLVGSLPAAGVALTLRVIDGSSGDALAGVTVDGGPFVAQVSDPRGDIRATEVLAGTYTLRLQPSGGAVQRRRVTVSEGESELVISVEIEASP